MPESGAPSLPSKPDELLHLDSDAGGSGAESEARSPRAKRAEDTRPASAETGADADDLDSMSDATDCSDIFHIEELPEGSHESGMRSWATYEDRVQALIDRLAEHMRDYPLMPPDVADKAAEATYRDMDSCIRCLLYTSPSPRD